MSSRDSFDRYCEEIGAIPLITPKEELRLAALIKKGDKDAYETLCRANLKFVVSIAKSYLGMGLDLPDLVSEGNIGLFKAVAKFEDGHGAKFSTYAAFWIKQRIRRALSDQSTTIRLPVHVGSTLYHIFRTQSEMATALGREATIAEVAEKLDLPQGKVQKYVDASRPIVSLNDPFGNDEDDERCFADLIAADEPEAPYSPEAMRGVDLSEFLSQLTEKEQDILTKRFGLDGEDPMTLELVGQVYRVTRERIRQIEFEALRKLRAMISRRKTLDDAGLTEVRKAA